MKLIPSIQPAGNFLWILFLCIQLGKYFTLATWSQAFDTFDEFQWTLSSFTEWNATLIAWKIWDSVENKSWVAARKAAELIQFVAKKAKLLVIVFKYKFVLYGRQSSGNDIKILINTICLCAIVIVDKKKYIMPEKVCLMQKCFHRNKIFKNYRACTWWSSTPCTRVDVVTQMLRPDDFDPIEHSNNSSPQSVKLVKYFWFCRSCSNSVQNFEDRGITLIKH